MKFLDLEIELFLAITSAKINLADRGLVLIQGVNHSDTSAMSNGAGKSSIADALSWVLYGITARDETGDDIINDKAGKGTRVQVRILDGATTYRIVRHRKHKTGKNRLEVYQSNGLVETDLTKGTDKLTQDVVLKIIGASHDVFVGSIYAGQEKMPDLPGMTDKHLKLLIEEAAGVTVLEEAYKIAREDLAAAKARLDEANSDLDTLTRRQGWIEDQLRTTSSSIAVWDGSRDTEILRTTEEIAALVRDIKAIDVSFKLTEAEIELAGLDRKIAAVAGENAKFLELDRAVSAAEAKSSSINRELAGHVAAMKRLEEELAGVEHKVGCPCDECGRPLTEAELGEAKMAVARRITDKQLIIEEARLSTALAVAAVVKAEGERDDFLLSMTDLTETSAQRASLQRAINDHKSTLHRRESLLTRAKGLKEKIETRKAEENPHKATWTKLNGDLTTSKAAVEAQAKKVKELGHTVDLESENVRIYAPAGARATILDEVTPFLNMQTAKYLSVLSDGNIEATWSTLTKTAKGELKEKFSIDVTNAKGGKKFGSISGGEKKKVRVATVLALQDLVATRATKSIELFIGDEIDGALDPAGLERLTMVLEEKAAERGTVLVISHLELRDWISNVLQVEKSATGETTITELAA